MSPWLISGSEVSVSSGLRAGPDQGRSSSPRRPARRSAAGPGTDRWPGRPGTWPRPAGSGTPGPGSGRCRASAPRRPTSTGPPSRQEAFRSPSSSTSRPWPRSHRLPGQSIRNSRTASRAIFVSTAGWAAGGAVDPAPAIPGWASAVAGHSRAGPAVGSSVCGTSGNWIRPARIRRSPSTSGRTLVPPTCRPPSSSAQVPPVRSTRRLRPSNRPPSA